MKLDNFMRNVCVREREGGGGREREGERGREREGERERRGKVRETDRQTQ